MLPPQPSPTYSLRPYQRDAVQAVLAHFRSSTDSACLVLPTGAGKSVVIAELAAIARGRVLVLAHVAELCSQNFEKASALGVDAGLFVGGLGHKNASAKTTFATIQSAHRNLDSFTSSYSLVIVDECHRVGVEEDSQYQQLLAALGQTNPSLRLLGLTATPYRLDLGWVYRSHPRRAVATEGTTPFVRCVYDLTLAELLRDGYLIPPRIVDAPIAEYEFAEHGNEEKAANRLVMRHPRVTRAIAEQVLALAAKRRGVMLFAATVEHARELYSYLPPEQTALIVGETAAGERAQTIALFKKQQLKFLVNVAVLTTGFDAPHVDFIAILRSTESVALWQQIVGRGLRPSPGKADCLVVDYAGNGFSVFHAEVGTARPDSSSVPVSVPCPQCGHDNTFWGHMGEGGEVLEHFGRRCHGLITAEHNVRKQCTFRFRFKQCGRCGAENDTAARTCSECSAALSDPDDILKAALGLKDACVQRTAGMTLRAVGTHVVVTYHDEDGSELSERFDVANPSQRAIFYRLFARRTVNGEPLPVASKAEAIAARTFRGPDFVVARKFKRGLRVQARLFDYDGRRRKANQL